MKDYLITGLLLLITTFSTIAQSTIEGSITDQMGTDLAGITVAMINQNNPEWSRSLSTDETGYFIIDHLIAGNYQLEIADPNYETVTIKHFEFPRDNEQVLGLTLEDKSDDKNVLVKKERNDRLVNQTGVITNE